MIEVERTIWLNENTTLIEGEEFLPGWYFSDEAYDFHGPFATLDEARVGSMDYVESMSAHLDMEDSHWDMPDD